MPAEQAEVPRNIRGFKQRIILRMFPSESGKVANCSPQEIQSKNVPQIATYNATKVRKYQNLIDGI